MRAARRRSVSDVPASVSSSAAFRCWAHDLVYDICRDAIRKNRPLQDLLAEHPEVSKHVTRAQLAQFCDPMNNLGQAGVMVDRVLASLKQAQ